MDIPRLTKTQITEYLGVNAFARPRTDELSVSRSAAPVQTDTVQQSLGLLSKMAENMTTIRSNLDLMRQLANEAKNPGRLRDSRRQEIFGQLRSLSAGIDIIAKTFELDGKTLLTGQRLALESGTGDVRISLDNLRSSDEDGLNLSRKREGAFTTIDYDLLARMRNASSDLIGLDLSDAAPAEVAPDQQELETGEYRIKITYRGADSSVDIQNMDGTTLRKVSGVDLSGNGQELVDMGVGVKFSFEKTLFRTALGGDKYDYDLFGPTSLYANLNYERNEQHELFSGEDLDYVRENSVSVTRGGMITGTTGSLGVSASVAGVQEGRGGMSTGQYRVRVRYEGERSSVWLYDPNGALISTKRGLDLTGGDALSVDMETGVRIKLDPKDFTSDTRDYNTYLDYKSAEQPDELFDYRSYVKQIESALATLDEQLEIVYGAQDELTARYQQAQAAQQSAMAGAGVSVAQSVWSMLSSAVDSSLLGTINGSDSSGSSSAGSQLFMTQGDIFGSLESTLQAQANVDPSILALL